MNLTETCVVPTVKFGGGTWHDCGMQCHTEELCFSLRSKATSTRMAFWTFSDFCWDINITLFSKMIVRHATELPFWSSRNLTKTCVVYNDYHRVLISIPLKIWGEILERQLGMQDVITSMNCNRHWSISTTIGNSKHAQMNMGCYRTEEDTQNLTLCATILILLYFDKYFKINLIYFNCGI